MRTADIPFNPTEHGHSLGTREHARDILSQAYEAYKLARRDRPRESYQPFGYSGNAAIISSQDLLHRRVRDLIRNTPQAKRIIGAIVNLVIGRGLQTYSWPFLPSDLLQISTELETLDSGELGPRLKFALESDDLFDEWFNDPQQFDISGRYSGPEVQRMMMAESATVGNGFLIRCMREDYKLVPLAFKLIEREQLDMTHDRPRLYGKNKIVSGVEFDGNDKPLAYHFYLDHPQDFFGGSMSALLGAGAIIPAGNRRVVIPAERVIDLSLFHRPSAALGISWLDACGQTQWDRDSYCEAEIRSAAIDAVFAFVAKLKDVEQYPALGMEDYTPDCDIYGNREYKVGHSPIAAQIGPDESLEMVRAMRPNKDAPAFLKLLDRDTSAAVGLSYYSVTGDYESTNFSSTRAAKMDEDLNIAPLQDWFATHQALPIRRMFNAMAASLGLFQSITPAEFRKNIRTYQRFDAIGSGRDLLDPFKEGEARTTRLATGISTFKQECARNGIHWIRQLMQIALERRVSKVFGVQLQFDAMAALHPEKDEGDVENPSGGQDEQTQDKQAKKIADRVALLLDKD